PGHDQGVVFWMGNATFDNAPDLCYLSGGVYVYPLENILTTMSTEMWYTLAILAIAIVLFITEWLRVDVVALGVVVALMVSGVLSTSEALSGFSNPVVLIVAALFIVGGAVLQTGLAGMIGQRILIIAGPSESRLILVIMLAAGLLSGLMSDTGTVAVLLPAIVSLARSANISPSKLLIPVSYGALLGGATTLIGTPPNIIVSDILREQGEAPFQFFSYTPVGLLMLMAGTVFMVTVGRRILPDHKTTSSLQQQVQSPEELMNLYRLPDNLFRLRVPQESTLTGQTLADSCLRERFNVTVLEIVRAPKPQAIVRLGDQRLVLQSETLDTLYPNASTGINADDVLIVQGAEAAVKQAVAFWNLILQPVSPADGQSLLNQEAGIAEVLLPPRSTLLGKTLVDVRFGSTYKLTVLNLIRPGQAELTAPLKELSLQVGDILLVQGYWQSILALRQHARDFVVLGQPESMAGALYRHRAPVAFLILVGMLVALVSGIGSVAMVSMAASLLIVLTGCLTMDDAYAAIDWKSIVLIAGMLPMSTALEKVGLVQEIAQGLTSGLGDFGPLVIMAGLFLMASIFTQVISNTATTVIIAPIALATARELDVTPHAFLMAVSIAASMAFASPVASPVNTLVMGAGRYRFADYIRVGVPMILIMLIVTLIGVPLLWPF
ncbi:MAG: SLC13 family permease, partial [Anaerolineae bacterium]|nr:SLC13 family permease [Anaerolineae bacterium]